ncbi:hypothetical protein HW132_02205 [Brasilonema sp. CT11]|nr:hypothetical protein [Brasilonema sp. CT11]
MNRALSVFARPIPYHKELRNITGSVLSAILMQQLEFRFDGTGDGFYKFMQPCQHKAYREGDSWEEELNFSVGEFRTAFDRIGIRYKSKREYSVALAKGEVFGEDNKYMYCSYHDKIKGLTFYFRNHQKVAEQVEVLTHGEPIYVTKQKKSTEMKNPDSRKLKIVSYVAEESSDHLYTENTSENNYLENTYIEEHVQLFQEVSELVPDEIDWDSIKLLNNTEEQNHNLSFTPEEPPETLIENEITHEDKIPAPVAASFDKSEQSNYQLIESVESLPLMPGSKRLILPWENPGRSRNDLYKWDFAEWLYTSHLKQCSTFTKDGFRKNKNRVRNYLLKAHSDATRLETLANFWNEFVTNLTPVVTFSQSPLESFLTRCGDELRRIVLRNNFTQAEIQNIAECWEAANKDEELVIMMMERSGLIDDF